MTSLFGIDEALVWGLCESMGGKPASSCSLYWMDGVGLEVRDERDESRFSQLELVLDPRFSMVLLLAAVLGRRIERRDLELSREGRSSWNVSSLRGGNSLGAEESRFD